MKRFRKISSLVLLLLYVTFFTSTNLCVHSHDIGGQHIVHSHLGGGSSHSHSYGQIQTINFFSTESFNASEMLGSIPQPDVLCSVCSGREAADVLISYKSSSLCLRAPPCLA